MPEDPNLVKLKDARDKCAEVFEAEATDDLHDNGNLDNIHQAVIHIENAIQIIERR